MQSRIAENDIWKNGFMYVICPADMVTNKMILTAEKIGTRYSCENWTPMLSLTDS